MLKLQNGKFDAPDRCFYSVSETWQNSLNNDTDVKELIPEFFSSTGKFLSNKQGVELGIREDSNKVNDVILPKWANDSTAEFIYQNRMALESTYVSSHIHEWIDLIFGYKQRGEESIKANTNWVVFEPNDEVLWARVKRTIELFLSTVWRSGALAGTTADEAFFVNIGRATMSQDDIDNGRLICVIGVAPVKPAEFVIFRITQKTAESGT
jgi:hypothetical protein